MSNTLHEVKFAESMKNLQVGDLICRIRDGKSAFAVVLETHSGKGYEQFLILSQFSSFVMTELYPKRVFFKDGWLVDESGGILLLPEEWESTDKAGAKKMTEAFAANESSSKNRATKILLTIADPNKGLIENAAEILKIIGREHPKRNEIELLAFALKCASEHVWIINE